MRFCWVVDFPLFEGIDEEGRPHCRPTIPFTMPNAEDLEAIGSDP